MLGKSVPGSYLGFTCNEYHLAERFIEKLIHRAPIRRAVEIICAYKRIHNKSLLIWQTLVVSTHPYVEKMRAAFQFYSSWE